MSLKTYKNAHQYKLLQITFQDKDVIHLCPGESLTCDSKYVVIKEIYI